jgi:hypothetical protein
VLQLDGLWDRALDDDRPRLVVENAIQIGRLRPFVLDE